MQQILTTTNGTAGSEKGIEKPKRKRQRSKEQMRETDNVNMGRKETTALRF